MVLRKRGFGKPEAGNRDLRKHEFVWNLIRENHGLGNCDLVESWFGKTWIGKSGFSENTV